MTPKTKSECARLVRKGLAHETFAHETLGHFDISNLRRIIEVLARRKVIEVHHCRFDQVQFDGKVEGTTHLFAHREIDVRRAHELTGRQLREPLIFLLCPPGTNGETETHLLVDGIHRMYERKQRGMDDFKFYLFPLDKAPRVNRSEVREIPWGDKEVVPGVGLVNRERK